MPAGRNPALVDTAIVAFGSVARGPRCAAVGLTAAVNCGSVLLDRGMAW